MVCIRKHTRHSIWHFDVEGCENEDSLDKVHEHFHQNGCPFEWFFVGFQGAFDSRDSLMKGEHHNYDHSNPIQNIIGARDTLNAVE